MDVRWLIHLLLLSILGTCISSEKYKLGGIFEHTHRRQTNIFRRASILYGVDVVTETVERNDFLSSSKAVCKMLKEGVAGVFVPPTVSTAQHIATECITLNIPLIRGLVNVYLPPDKLNKLYIDLIKKLKWNAFTLLYEDSIALVHHSELLKTFSSVSVRQLDVNRNYRGLLQELREADEKNFVIDCKIGALPEVLKQAQQAGLMTHSHSYIFTSMDLHTLDLEPYQYSGTRIIGVKAIEPVNEALQILKMEEHNVNVSSAFVYDSVIVYAQILQKLNLSYTSRECEQASDLEHATVIADYIKNNEVSMPGMTGHVQLDKQGNRTNMELQILQLQENGLTTIGKWNSSDRLKLRLPAHPMRIKNNVLPGLHLKVLTLLSNPYVMKKYTDEELHGNDRFEGYVIDMLEELSQILGFTYEIKLNYEYGSLDPQTNKWTGMLHELQMRRADMVIADLTITAQRYFAFEFTTPFINTGISILYFKPSPHHGFSVLSLFSLKLWFCLAVCFIFVALMFYILARLSPFQRHSKKNAGQFTFENSLWFAVASLRPLGCGIEPKSISTRFMALVWWHFVAFLVATYVGGLVALLQSEGAAVSPIKNVQDLAEHGDIKYGALRRGSTLHFFRDSSDPMFQRMYTEMVSSPDVLVPSTEAGIERVKTEKGGYAFLTDALTIEYAVTCDPDLIQVGGLLNYKGFGIALPHGSPYRKALNAGLLHMKESGRLFAFKVRWWHRPCHKGPITPQALGFQFSNLASAFLLLVIVCIVAIVIALFERKFKKPAQVQGQNPTISITKPTPEAKARRHHRP